MAYYAALVSVLQLLEEINHPQHPYPNPLLPKKHQIHASLYEKFKLVRELLEDYSPKDESADILEGQIRDASYHALNIIESQISNHISNQELEKVEEEVGSILVRIMRNEKEKVSIHGDNLQGTNFSASSPGASTQAPRIDGVGGASKVQDRSGRSTTVVLDENLITTIKSQICGEPSSRAVISLVGMGGLGKTTLAGIIFDEELIHYRFDCRVWITASQDYHRRNALLAIVDSLNMERKEELKVKELGVIRERIYKHLKGRRYIIVIDDIWEAKVWDDVKMILPNDNNGSRVIITTRLLDVAVYVDSARFIHELQFLSEYQSWSLFRQKVFCPTELENIGWLIAKNCRGLPLAIVLVAGLLSKVNKTRPDWEEIARDVSSAAIGQNDEHYLKILSLSYKHLPHHLKPCFLYLGGFPEDYDIRASELIWLWIAEGLLQPIADKSLEEVGEEYLEDLIQRNLVLITEKKSCGKTKKCGIHDLLRDLCLLKARSERFFHCLHSFRLLKVLDTRLTRGSTFPEVVGIQLRYLALHKPGISFSPVIFKFQNLQTLIMGPDSSLPSEIWGMPQLRHVKGEGLEFPPIPHDEIKIIDGAPLLLGNLQTLKTIRNFKFTRDTIEMIPNLKKLKVESEGTWEEYQLNNLVHLCQLEVLTIELVDWWGIESPLPENFALPSTLIKLTLLSCELPWNEMRLVGSLPNLRVLKLKSNSFMGEEWKPAEGEFPKLKSLLMSHLYCLKYWQAEDIHFPCLEKLHIIKCIDLLEIPLRIGDIPTLESIVVEECNSGVDSSALKIQEEQQDLGNDDLHVHVVPARW